MESGSDYEDEEIKQMEERIRALEAILGSGDEFVLSPREEGAELESVQELSNSSGYDHYAVARHGDPIEASVPALEPDDVEEPHAAGEGLAATIAPAVSEAEAPELSLECVKEEQPDRASGDTLEESGKTQVSNEERKNRVRTASDESSSNCNDKGGGSDEQRGCSLLHSGVEVDDPPSQHSHLKGRKSATASHTSVEEPQELNMATLEELSDPSPTREELRGEGKENNGEAEELRVAEERLEARIVALEKLHGVQGPENDSAAEESHVGAPAPPVLVVSAESDRYTVVGSGHGSQGSPQESVNEVADGKYLEEPDSPVAVATVLKSPARATGKIAALALSIASKGASPPRSPSPTFPRRRTGALSSIRSKYEAAASPTAASPPLATARSHQGDSEGKTPRKAERREIENYAAPARVQQLVPEEVETRNRRNSIRQMQQQGLLPKPVMLKQKFDEIAAEELQQSEAEQAKDLAAKNKLTPGSSPARQDLIAMQRQEVFKSIIARGREVFSRPEPEAEQVPKGKRLSSYTRAAPSGRKLPSRYRNSKRLSRKGGVDQSVMLAILERRKHEDEEREALQRKQEEEQERKREERRRREEQQAKVFRSALKRKVVHKHERRLIWCKGKRRVYARIAPCTCDSLNQGDTFVLDDDKTIYVWCGAKSNRMEKAKGAAIARIIKDHDRNSHAKIVTIDQYSDEGEQAGFFALLGGNSEEVARQEDGGDDEKWDQRMREEYQLFGVAEDGARALLEPAAKGISMHQLETACCYLLDTKSELYWWAGKKAPASLLKAAEDAASSLAEGRDLTAVKVPEGTEPLLFREKFVDWPDLSHPVVMKRTWGVKKREAAEPSTPAFHPRQMLLENRLQKLASEEDRRPVSDGHGELMMWVVDGFRKKPYHGRVGSFHSGNCYILHYWYRFSETERHALYYWQGSGKNRTETGACSLLTTELYQQLRKRNDVVVAETEQELQGLESEHFVTIFNADVARRGMVVHCGRSGEEVAAPVRIYHIKEVSRSCPCGPAIEVDLNGASVASCLNSRHCFVVVAAQQESGFLWCGRGASDHLRAHARELAPRVEGTGDAVTLVIEGEETSEFLRLLGCKERAELLSAYAHDEELAKSQRVTREIPAKPRPERRMSSLPVVYSLPEYSFEPPIPRLFHCSQLTGKWAAVEMPRFCQSDLKEADAYILESSGGVFAWLGAKSSGFCRSWTKRIAEEYAALRKGQGAPLTLRTEAAGRESLLFRSHFHAWKPSGASAPSSKGSPAASHASHAAEKDCVPEDAKKEGKEPRSAETYALAELQTSRSLPDHVMRAKEQYLNDVDFEAVFKMSKESFNSLAAWKKLHLKKANKLF